MSNRTGISSNVKIITNTEYNEIIPIKNTFYVVVDDIDHSLVTAVYIDNKNIYSDGGGGQQPSTQETFVVESSSWEEIPKIEADTEDPDESSQIVLTLVDQEGIEHLVNVGGDGYEATNLRELSNTFPNYPTITTLKSKYGNAYVKFYNDTWGRYYDGNPQGTYHVEFICADGTSFFVYAPKKVNNYDFHIEAFNGGRLYLKATPNNIHKINEITSVIAESHGEIYYAGISSPKTATISITESLLQKWLIDAGYSKDYTLPYTYKTYLSLNNNVSSLLVDLLNTDAKLFSDYGFAIHSIENNVVEIWSVGCPMNSVSLTFVESSCGGIQQFSSPGGATLYKTSQLENDADFVSKSYHDNTKLDKTGGTLTGNLSMGDNKISNLGSPVSDNDATNKKYVDDAIAGVSGGGINYSTNEQDTGVKWIDGKTIYQKTYNIGNKVVNGNAWLDINLDGTNVENIIQWCGDCTFYYDQLNEHASLNSYGKSNVLNFEYTANVGKRDYEDLQLRIKNFSSGNKNFNNIYVTIWYTKP